MTTIRIRLQPGAHAPTRATTGAAAFDLHALAAGTLPAGGRAVVDTGVHLELPHDGYALVCPRSGLAAKHGVTVLNTPGVIDPDYRGPIGIILHNTSRDRFEWETGDRLAQLLIPTHPNTTLTPTDQLTTTTRGHNGFGSTGKTAA